MPPFSAGRSVDKLKKVLKEVGEELKQDLSKVQIIEANADSKQSLVEMTKQCKVLVTVVGPYQCKCFSVCFYQSNFNWQSTASNIALTERSLVRTSHRWNDGHIYKLPQLKQ